MEIFLLRIYSTAGRLFIAVKHGYSTGPEFCLVNLQWRKKFFEGFWSDFSIFKALLVSQKKDRITSPCSAENSDDSEQLGSNRPFDTGKICVYAFATRNIIFIDCLYKPVLQLNSSKQFRANVLCIQKPWFTVKINWLYSVLVEHLP